jgi:hypothetical protein
MDDFDTFRMPGMSVADQAKIGSAKHRNDLAEQQSQDIAQLMAVTINQNKNIKQLISVMVKQSQEIEQLVKITREQGKGTSKLSRISLIFSFIAVMLAGTAVFFSFRDFKGDAIWQKQQIDVLIDIKESIDPVKVKEESLSTE